MSPGIAGGEGGSRGTNQIVGEVVFGGMMLTDSLKYETMILMKVERICREKLLAERLCIYIPRKGCVGINRIINHYHHQNHQQQF